MPKPTALISQADISRSLRAAKQVGCKRLTIMLNNVPMVFDLDATPINSIQEFCEEPQKKKGIVL